MTNKKIKKVLIIRFSSIGDIVLTTPVVRCLKKQLSVEVHYLTKKSFQKLVLSNPYIDKVYSIQKNVTEISDELKKEGYDCIIDLHKNIRTKQVRALLRVPYYTFDKINWQKWVMVNFKINKLPKVHIVDRYMESVKTLGVINDGEGLDYFLPNDLNVDASDFPQSWIVFAIGGAHATKRLPTEKIIDICKKIKTPIILIGGKEDATIGKNVVLTLQSNNIINKCGTTSIDESAWIIKNAQQVITHDTGMMHIAAAFQKKIISIWGNTIPEFGMYPYYKNGIDNNKSVEVENLSCRPCSKIGFDKCPKGHFKCMREIDINKVI